MKALSFERSGLEELMDGVKAEVISSLVREGVLQKDIADSWCADHTLILRDKTVFETTSRLFDNEKKADNPYIFVVKKT